MLESEILQYNSIYSYVPNACTTVIISAQMLMKQNFAISPIIMPHSFEYLHFASICWKKLTCELKCYKFFLLLYSSYFDIKF